ncbi:MAG: START-like domain-containing protein [Bacteroidetes bacterium]|nr:START-like domain-containing protein [Bacteroidota bacterium]
MMEKVKFQQEYLINASAGIIYNCLITPSGLSEWFADDVNIKKDVYTFMWDGSEEYARLLTTKKDEYVKFRWVEDEDDEGDKDTFFEIRLRVDDLTQEVAILVTDFADDDEVDEAQLLWDSQIVRLKRVLGS